MVHSNLAVAAGADATRQKIDAINKSYSEVESLSKVETFKPLKLHGEMLSDLLETISKNPSGWTMQVGKETEMPIQKNPRQCWES
jgi:hypothetical protein